MTQSSNSADIEEKQSKRYSSFSPESDVFQIEKEFRVFGNIRSSSVEPD